MKFFFDFIRSRIVTLVCVITAAVIFTVILSLYDLPTEPVLYALLLSVAAIVAIGVFSFIKAYRKHNILVRHRINRLNGGEYHVKHDLQPECALR